MPIKKIQVLSYGGSLLFDYRGKFKKRSVSNFLETIWKRKHHSCPDVDNKFLIIVGGGYHCRLYQGALRELGISSSFKDTIEIESDPYKLDTIGIDVSRVNARILNYAYYSSIGMSPEIPKSVEEIKETLEKNDVVFAGGLKAGQTTDMVALEACLSLGVDELINLTNVDGIYNPKSYPRKKELIKEIDAKELSRLIGQKHIPGLNYPIEPNVVERIRDYDFAVRILNENLDSPHRI